MTLEATLKCGSLKALAIIRGLSFEITDRQVVQLFNEMEFRNNQELTWRAAMRNLHGASEEQIDACKNDSLATTFYKFVSNTVMRELNANDVAFDALEMYHLGAGRSILAICMMLDGNAIRADQAKFLLKEVLKQESIGKEIESMLYYNDWLDEDTSAMDDVIKEIIAANPQIIAEFKSGKEKVLGSLIGQVMKKLKGNPQEITAKIKAMI